MNGEQTTMLATSGSKSGLMKPTNQKVAEAVARINRDKEESSATTSTPEVSETLETAETESTDAPKETSETKVAAAPKAKAKSVKAKAKPASKPVKAKASAKVKAKVKAKSVKAVKAKPVKAKAVKAKAAKAVKPAKPAKAKATKPVSGQSGPALSLTGADLNKNETKLLCSFGDYKGGEEISIAELAKETFPSKPKAQANSWVRNALRRLVRADLVSKTDRGTYKLTKAGRSLV